MGEVWSRPVCTSTLPEHWALFPAFSAVSEVVSLRLPAASVSTVQGAGGHTATRDSPLVVHREPTPHTFPRRMCPHPNAQRRLDKPCHCARGNMKTDPGQVDHCRTSSGKAGVSRGSGAGEGALGLEC